MGTNYYITSNECQCCNRYDTDFHIGKSSYGWAFSFHGYRGPHIDVTLSCWAEWKEYLKDKTIRTEYGDKVDYQNFCHMIETVKAPGYVREDGHRNLCHNEEGRKGPRPWFNSEWDWDDEDGYSFCSREFS